MNLHCPDPPTSNTGAYQISWEVAEGARVELFEDGELIYAGQDPGSTVTGRPEGPHVYTLRVDGELEHSCEVRVEHPALELALGLFGLGALVFALTLALVLRGDRQQRRGGPR